MTRAAARAARRAFGTAPFNPIGWVSSGAYGGAASKSFQLEGLSLTHETPGPVIKLEWVNAKSSTPGISWIFASTTEERTPSMLQLTLCNHPDLPDVVSDENRDAIKACYQRKLGVAEHTTRTYSEDAELSTTEEIFGQKGVRRAMNRCFLWQRDPLAMTAMELVGVDASERATVRAIASEEVSMVARGGARAREVPMSDVFGGFPVAHVEATTSLADVAYCLRSIWPDPVDSIAVAAGGRVIAALEAGAADAEALAVGDSTAITAAVAKAVAEQEGPVRLKAASEEAADASLAWLSKVANVTSEFPVTITINGIECRVICANDISATSSLRDKVAFVGAGGVIAFVIGARVLGFVPSG